MNSNYDRLIEYAAKGGVSQIMGLTWPEDNPLEEYMLHDAAKIAAKYGYSTTVPAIMRYGEKILNSYQDGLASSLEKAYKEQDIESLRLLMTPDQEGKFLKRSIASGKIENLRFLFEELGRAADDYPLDVLCYAIEFEQYEVAEFFIECGVDILRNNNFSFRTAVKRRRPEFIRLTLDAGASLEDEGSKGFWLLMLDRDIDTASRLVDNGNEIHVDPIVMEALINHGEIEALEYLFDNFIVDMNSDDLNLAVMAANHASGNTLQWLIDKGLDMTVKKEKPIFTILNGSGTSNRQRVKVILDNIDIQSLEFKKEIQTKIKDRADELDLSYEDIAKHAADRSLSTMLKP